MRDKGDLPLPNTAEGLHSTATSPNKGRSHKCCDLEVAYFMCFQILVLSTLVKVREQEWRVEGEGTIKEAWHQTLKLRGGKGSTILELRNSFTWSRFDGILSVKNLNPRCQICQLFPFCSSFAFCKSWLTLFNTRKSNLLPKQLRWDVGPLCLLDRIITP